MKGSAGDTPKGRAARARIVEAAWGLLDGDEPIPLTAGLSIRTVAAAAGVSPGAVQHHFPTMADLSDAMVDSILVDLSLDPVEAAEDGIQRFDVGGFADAVRSAAQFNWDALNTEQEIEFERRVRHLYAVSAGEGAAAAVLRERLRVDLWGAFRPTIEAMMDSLLRAAGRRPVEPFTVADIAQLLGALADGLITEAMCGAVPVRSGMYAESVVALALALTVPERRVWTLVDVDAGLHQPSGSGLQGVDEAVTVACRAADLFADGYLDVGLAAVAAAAGPDVTVESVVEAFGTSRGVAAVSFARHLPGLRETAGRRRALSAELALADLVFDLARRAAAEPWVAAALLHERVTARVGEAGRPTGIDVDGVVPLDDLFGDLLADIQPRLDDGERGATASLMVDATLDQAAGRSQEALGALVGRVLRLMPPLD